MTPAEAIQVLEGLKDYINENGKRELTVIQKAIEGWMLGDPAEPPAPPIAPSTVVTQAAAPAVVFVPETPEPEVFKPTNVRKKVVKKSRKK